MEQRRKPIPPAGPKRVLIPYDPVPVLAELLTRIERRMSNPQYIRDYEWDDEYAQWRPVYAGEPEVVISERQMWALCRLLLGPMR